MTTEVLRGIANGAIKGLSDLAPEIAEYQYHTSMVWAVIAGIVIVASLIALVIGIKIGLRDDWEFYEIMITVVACALLIFAFAVFISEMDDIYLAKYYPEKLVLRELRHLLNNH
jgi:hypothetical protein